MQKFFTLIWWNEKRGCIFAPAKKVSEFLDSLIFFGLRLDKFIEILKLTAYGFEMETF